jgi:ribonuclease HI
VLIQPKKTLELSGGAPDTTNNRMELTAAIEALRALKQPCAVDFYTDSQYLQKGITGWLPAWKRRGWRKANGEPVLNVELWQTLDDLCSRHAIRWHWVRGHAGNAYNERADQLASAAIPR